MFFLRVWRRGCSGNSIFLNWKKLEQKQESRGKFGVSWSFACFFGVQLVVWIVDLAQTDILFPTSWSFNSKWLEQWRQWRQCRRRWWRPRKWARQRLWPREVSQVSWPIPRSWRRLTSAPSWTLWLRLAPRRWRSLASLFFQDLSWSRPETSQQRKPVRRWCSGRPREGGVASTWSRHAGNNPRQIPPQSAVVACSASTPAVTSPSSSVWRRSLCVLEFGRTPNLMTVTLFYDFVVWAWTSSEVPVGMSSWASGSPNGVSSDVWCGMLGWDAVTLSKAWQTRKVVTSEKVGLSRSVLDFLGWQSWEPSVVGGGWLAPGLVTC